MRFYGATKSSGQRRNDPERKICKDFVSYLQGCINLNQIIPDNFIFHHSPNGGKRDVREGRSFKQMGVRAGFPDYIFIWSESGIPKLAFLEFKASAKQKLSKSQVLFRDECYLMGVDFEQVSSVNEAVSFLQKLKILK